MGYGRLLILSSFLVPFTGLMLFIGVKFVALLPFSVPCFVVLSFHSTDSAVQNDLRHTAVICRFSSFYGPDVVHWRRLNGGPFPFRFPPLASRHCQLIRIC